MLAEMARAFNIGLGLNGLGTNGGTSRIEGSTATPRAPEAPSDAPAEDQQQQPPTTAPPPIPIPPEGSFERFLVDLQVDLRRALTQPEDERQSRPSSVLSEAGNEASEDDHAVDDVTTSSGHDTAESTAPVEYSDTESESDVEHEDGTRFLSLSSNMGSKLNFFCRLSLSARWRASVADALAYRRHGAH